MDSDTTAAIAGAVAGGFAVLLTQTANRVWDLVAARRERTQQWENLVFRASLEVRTNMEIVFLMLNAIGCEMTTTSVSSRLVTILDKELDQLLLCLHDPFLHIAEVNGFTPKGLRPLIRRLAACGDAVRGIQIYSGTWLGLDKPDVVKAKLNSFLYAHLLVVISVHCSKASHVVRQIWSRTEVERMTMTMSDLGLPWQRWLDSWDMAQDCIDVQYTKKLIDDLVMLQDI